MTEHFDGTDPAPKALDFTGGERFTVYHGEWSGRPRFAAGNRGTSPGTLVTPACTSLLAATRLANGEIERRIRFGNRPGGVRYPDPTEIRSLALLRIATFYEGAPEASLRALLDLLHEPAADPWVALDLLRTESLSVGPAAFTELYREVFAGAPVEWVLAYFEGPR